MTIDLLPAPTAPMRLANYSGGDYDGWVRTTHDGDPLESPVRLPDGMLVVPVLGPHVGAVTAGHAAGAYRPSAQLVDVRCRIRGGSVASIDWRRDAVAAEHVVPVPPPEVVAALGTASIGGRPLRLLSFRVEGAAYAAHLRQRLSRLLCIDVWVRWYPDQPATAQGEVMVTASNPMVPDVTDTVPPGMTLLWGSADVFVPGLPLGAPLIQGGTPLADGQCRAFPFTLVWRDLLGADSRAWQAAGALATGAIMAVGCRQPWPLGSPPWGAESRLAWTRKHWSGAVAALHRIQPESGVGPSMRSNDTGSQADQVFVGGECAGLDGIGAETVRYLVALTQGRRPCHHLEGSGDPLDLDLHADLVFWDGRPHWHHGVSPDQLGKSRSLTDLDTGGWWGPDVEHWLINNLAVAARLTGSPALQRLLEAQARVYLLQWTAQPGLSTSQPYAARAIGWEALGVYHLRHALRDSYLAQQVTERWLQRMRTVILPSITGDIWDIRIDDARLGPGPWWIPWQQAVGAYGMHLLSSELGLESGIAAARVAALRVVSDAWRQDGTGWVCAEQKPVAEGGDFSGQFAMFGMPLAAFVADPTSDLSAWLRANGAGSQWIPPEFA